MTCPRPSDEVTVVYACVLGAVPAVVVPAASPCSHILPPPIRADDIATTARTLQWPLAPLGTSKAWRRTRGEEVTVAVLDTGVDSDHPDLSGAVINGPDLTGSGRDGPPRCHHGTAMASIIAGRGHGANHAQGVIGIAPAATILSIKVTLDNDDPQRGRTSLRVQNPLARGIRYAADHGAKVISMSLGGGSGSWNGSAIEEKAVRYALGRGAVLVASSGNDGSGPNRKNFPAAYPGVMAVGAVDEKMRVAPFSNRQEYLSVVAPGTRIVSAGGTDSYVVGDGTSAAAAMVTGVVALIRSEFPRLTPAQVRQAIETGTTRAPAGGHSPAYGHGVINAARALKQAARAQRRPLRSGTARPDRADRDPARHAGTSRGVVCLVLILLALGVAAHMLVRYRRRRVL
ncbi:S8 family serine peptidase [Streptosporangium sp. NPDC000396]|uniref:S8 family serine peptidase n=1 Tax=Streptosporangium sp. NPDC000396 TaxID=3366185 RepID=UPI0036C25020